MVMHQLHPRHVLSRDDECLALALIHNRAPELDYAVSNDNIDLRCPGLLRALRHDLIAYRGIVCGRRLELTCNARQRVQQIGTADNADKLAVLYDWQALDTVALH